MTLRFSQTQMEPVYGVCHYLVAMFHDVLFPGSVHGVENIPGRGGLIIAANHASVLDPPIIGCHVPRQLAFFARNTLWRGGIASWWLDAVGTIPVARDAGSDVSALKRVLHVLQDGGAVILFPEGTRTETGALQTPRAGVGLLACRTGVPVVPTRIFGTFAAFGRKGPFRVGIPVSVIFGPPLQATDYDRPGDGKKRYEHASARIMNAIAGLQIPPTKVI